MGKSSLLMLPLLFRVFGEACGIVNVQISGFRGGLIGRKE
jgi:hypothetical protein